MPTEKQPQRGIKSPYSVRYGVDVGPCEGLDLAHDPSTVARTALTQAVNARVHDGIVLSRGGQEQVTGAEGMSGCVQGLIEVSGSGARLALLRNEAGGPAPNGNVLAGFELYDGSKASLLPGFTVTGLGKYTRVTDKDTQHDSLRLEQEVFPPVGQNTFQDDTKPRYAIIWWDGFPVYYTDDQVAPKPQLFKVVVPEDDGDADGFNVEPLLDLITDDGGAPIPIEFYPSSMASLPNTGAVNVNAPAPLYFGTMNGGVVAYVDGAFYRLLDEATFSSRVIVFTYNNRLFAAGKQKIMFQTGGWVDGGTAVSTAFTDVTMPAGALPSGVVDFRPNCAGEAFGAGFVGGWDQGEASAGKGVVIKLTETAPATISASIPVGIYKTAADRKQSFTDMRYGYSNRLWVTFVDIDAFRSGLGYIDGNDDLIETPGYIPSDATNGAYCIMPTANQVLFFNTGDDHTLYSYRDGGSPVIEVDIDAVDDEYHATGGSSDVPYDGVLY